MIGKPSNTSIIQTTTRIITMNKAELVDSITEKTGHTQADTIKTIDALMETIEATVAKRGKVLRSGSEPSSRITAQQGQCETPRPANLPKFTPGKLFKERVVEAHKPKTKPKATTKGQV